MRQTDKLRTDVARPANLLLARLPALSFAALRPRPAIVPLRPRQVLHKQGDPLHHVYFPTGGIVSMATVLSDGATVEAATVGSEGIVGIEAFFSEHSTASCEAIVQSRVPGQSAVRMQVADFRRALSESKALHEIVARYAQVMFARVTRLTACNVRHDVDKRCARWLLAASDHMEGEDFHLSQEFLAVMLGVRRQTVSVVARTFRAAGMIRYVHGNITILNRRALEAASCDCYAAIARLYKVLHARG
jgi:CRP-like cAMP-binding protein